MDWRVCQVGRVAQLPKPTTPLPRAKPVPQPRQPTKWEAFAQRKGIVKRKRGREVFDEEAGEYRRRHGYKRAGDESEVPIIEASASDAVRRPSPSRAPACWPTAPVLHYEISGCCSCFWLSASSAVTCPWPLATRPYSCSSISS